MQLAERLQIKQGVSAVIGGGGKTTLLYALAKELGKNHRVILTTTTHIRVPPHLPTVQTEAELREALTANPVVTVGTPTADGKLTVPQIGMEKLAELAEFVLVEADGAKMLPVKAHADYEPVIPPCTNQVICVLGLSAIGKPIGDCVHRAEIFAKNLGVEMDAVLTEELAARHLKRENLHTRVFLNQADTEREQTFGRRLAENLGCSVCMGALEKGWAICLY